MNNRYSKIRNIGIIAHIDAGKTTLTERLLFYTGINKKVGDVHYGTTTMDWMEQERERGITIVSAATRMSWLDHDINLIDTPGHLDFNLEVEKSLCVLEGAVTVIDAGNGVEPQTECVWNQANRYKVARVIVVNKMDKENASFYESITSIKQRLSKTSVPIVAPVFDSEGKFIGIYDLIWRKKGVWLSRDHSYEYFEFDNLTEYEQDLLSEYRQKMIVELTDYSDILCEKVLNEDEISDKFLFETVVELSRSVKIFPVLCCSAFHNKAVQSVLDAVVYFLPSPDQNTVEAYDMDAGESKVINITDEETIAFIFKVVFDVYAGEICYARIYSGSIRNGDFMTNTTTGRKVRIQSIVRFHSNARQHIPEAFSGDIVGLVCAETVTADTLCSIGNKYKITKIKIPESVIDVAIMPETKTDQDKFARFIGQYVKEDPTIKVKYNVEQQETVISGIGKLQLEILFSRLKTEKGISVKPSKPKISYRETITKEYTIEHLHKKQTGGAGQFAGVTIRVFPSKKQFDFVNKITKGAIPRQFIPEIEKSCREMLQQGILTKSPMINIGIELLDGRFHPVDSSTIAYYICTRDALIMALKECEAVLLEPIFSVTIYTPGERMNRVISYLCAKRGIIISVVRDESKTIDYRIIEAELPLEHIFDYAEQLRSDTQGQASCTYSFLEYRQCNKETI